MSIRLVAAVSAFGLVYGLITSGDFAFAYAFTANLWVGATILTGGILVLITPTFLLIKKGPLTDHTTYAQNFLEERGRKHALAYELIYIGIFNISIISALQFIM
jgi:hypothetical protein